ncbi:hypothetical protein Scep_010372 [Stephania cephalantha]|uniref:Uncharacterized protein n=1 Tax=Stephania cephalantha TaxID=152367 RepID=A0AAP0JUX2_9MAGN
MAAVRTATMMTAMTGGPHRPENQNPSPRFCVSKPSWIVRTESNVWKEERRKPYPPCVVCGGSGKVNCHQCRGRGRTNNSDLAMLPKGEWPKWCKTCGGSGLGYCSRCLGNGEYRDLMGFRFMHAEPDRRKSPSQAHPQER